MTPRLVVSTRHERRGSEFVRMLERAGLQVWSVPTTRILPVRDPALSSRLREALTRAQWIALTSPRAATRLWSDAVVRIWWDAASRKPRVAVIGPSTAAAVRAQGANVDLVAARSTGAGLAEALVHELTGQRRAGEVRVLWPRAERADASFGEILSAHGGTVDGVVLYRTVPIKSSQLPGLRVAIERGAVAAICFTSPSAADALAAGFHRDNLALLDGTIVASFGPTTSAALRRLGVVPAVEAHRPDRIVFAHAIARAVNERGASLQLVEAGT